MGVKKEESIVEPVEAVEVAEPTTLRVKMRVRSQGLRAGDVAVLPVEAAEHAIRNGHAVRCPSED